MDLKGKLNRSLDSFKKRREMKKATNRVIKYKANKAYVKAKTKESIRQAKIKGRYDALPRTERAKRRLTTLGTYANKASEKYKKLSKEKRHHFY